MYKSQADSQSTITLLLGNIKTGIPDSMVSFGNFVINFNKDTLSVGTDLRARGEYPGKLLPQLFATYANCSLG